MTETTVTDDDRLEAALRAIPGSDKRAFETVYTLTSSRVLGLCRRILIDSHQAEEVTQEVFLEIWQNAARFDPNKGRAFTWIMTMAHRRAIDRVRASQSSRDRDLKVGIRESADVVEGVEDSVVIGVEYDRVADAMHKLSQSQRESLMLSYFGGLTQSEIATRLGVPLGTVKTRMRDALIRLRGLLGEDS